MANSDKPLAEWTDEELEGEILYRRRLRAVRQGDPSSASPPVTSPSVDRQLAKYYANL